MQHPKISIIIPVYNTSNYLKECLDSIVNQTEKDIEIICIDDGSKDNSLDILKNYADKDDRIKVFSQENKGVSAARNLGLEMMTGEYVMFVDSDDWIELNTCEILYKTITERNADILLFSYAKCTNNSICPDGRLADIEKTCQQENLKLAKNAKLLLTAPFEVAGKLYKTEIVTKNKHKFPENIKCGEDRYFYIAGCLYASTITVLNKVFYYYRVDTAGSLTKTSGTSFKDIYKVDYAVRKLINSTKGLSKEDKQEIHKAFLERSTRTIIYFFNTVYNFSAKTTNFKYLKQLEREYRKIIKKDFENHEEYNNLKKTIQGYKNLFFRKLFEPLFEIEHRHGRFVLYLFENQVLNFSTLKINNFKLNLYYIKHLLKLKFVSKFRKVKVAFWITEYQKWSFKSLYRALEKSPHFEPVVLLSYFRCQQGDISPAEHIQNNIKFLEENNYKYELAYNSLINRHYPLDKFKPDIIFYQQPWLIHQKQSLRKTSKFALTCYIPYCYYSTTSYLNYLYGFHGLVWKYFVETESHKSDYEKEYNARNCVAVGSAKLDNYEFVEEAKISKIWKTSKKRIIYAPHHSFNDGFHEVATFTYNGQFILDLAKKYSNETEWIFRPHPAFIDRVIKNKIMSYADMKKYFAEWEKTGKIYTDGNYYDMLAGSDCLITDSISFLAEYLPTGKPVLHLRKDNQIDEFNSLLKIITDDYYKIYDNDSLSKTFDDVVINGNDYMKDKRINNIKYLMIDKTQNTGEKIKEYLEKELWIRG